MSTAEPTYEPVICGHRETRATGTWECVMPTHHPDHGHYYVLLKTRDDGGAA